MIASIIATLSLHAQNSTEMAHSKEELSSVKKIIATGGNMQSQEISIVDGFKSMFENAKITGQIRSMSLLMNLVGGNHLYRQGVSC